MRTYFEDRQTADRFIPAMKRILAPHVRGPLVVSSDYADCREATDLISETTGERIACRTRSMDYYGIGRDQFTVRVRRDSGARTELEKILDGWGDLMLYGFDDGASEVLKWYLIDLDVFRWDCVLFPDHIRSEDKTNGDGTYFRVFWIKSFPDFPPLLISEGF